MHVQCTYPYLIFSRVFGIFVETFTLGEKKMKKVLFIWDGTAILLGHPSHVKV